MVIDEISSVQLTSMRPEEVASASSWSPTGLELPSASLSLREADSHLEESIQEKFRVCLPRGVDDDRESPSKAFLEFTLLLLSPLDICKQGTVDVSVCLLASNDLEDEK